MRPFHRLMLCAAATAFVSAAQAAPPRAADLPRINEGSTGFIGLTDSAGTARQPTMPAERSAMRTSGIPIAAGEASTTVNGQPNRDPNDPALRSPAPSTRAMGAPADWHRSWGTPD